MTKAELEREFEEMEGNRDYWRDLSEEFEGDVMRLTQELEDAEMEVGELESHKFDLRYMIENAESLEELKEELSSKYWL